MLTFKHSFYTGEFALLPCSSPLSSPPPQKVRSKPVMMCETFLTGTDIRSNGDTKGWGERDVRMGRWVGGVKALYTRVNLANRMTTWSVSEATGKLCLYEI